MLCWLEEDVVEDCIVMQKNKQNKSKKEKDKTYIFTWWWSKGHMQM